MEAREYVCIFLPSAGKVCVYEVYFPAWAGKVCVVYSPTLCRQGMCVLTCQVPAAWSVLCILLPSAGMVCVVYSPA